MLNIDFSKTEAETCPAECGILVCFFAFVRKKKKPVEFKGHYFG